MGTQNFSRALLIVSIPPPKACIPPKFPGLPIMALYCLRELPKMTSKPTESQTLVPSLSELRPGGPWTQVISETHLSSLAATSQPELGT